MSPTTSPTPTATAPARAVDRVTLRDGLAIERRTYFDPGPLLAATLTRPRAWPRFVLAQAKQLRYRLRKGAANA